MNAKTLTYSAQTSKPVPKAIEDLTEALKQLGLSDLTALAEDVEAKLKQAVDAAAA